MVYRWAYDYSVPGAKEDFIPQTVPPTDEEIAAIQSKHHGGGATQPAE